MDVNAFVDIAKKVTGDKPAVAPTVDHSAATTIALDMAKRQAEKPAAEDKPIPTLGTMPIPN